MKRSHTLLSLSGLAAALAFAGCSDDPSTPGPIGTAGTSTGTGGAVAGSSTTAGTPAVGGAAAGTFSTGGATAGSGGAGVSGGGAGGSAGALGGTGGNGGTTIAGTAGTGGSAPVIVPAVILIDNIRLQPALEGAGGDGSGGAGAGGEGGAGTAAAALLGGGAGGDGGAGPVGVPPDFVYSFDAMLDGFARQSNGFSPGPGGSGGPEIFSSTTVEWEAGTGNPGGAAKVTIPFSVATQQTDFGAAFTTPADLTGYELVADVKLVTEGDKGACIAAWPYVYGANGYANDKTGEPASGVTLHLVKDAWKRVRLNLDGPYGYHSVTAFKDFKPTGVTVWGLHINTWGCP